jgi:hypothetical protein
VTGNAGGSTATIRESAARSVRNGLREPEREAPVAFGNLK